MADPKDLAAQLEAFNAIEAQGQPFYKKQLPMEGRATFLPFRDTMEGSVFNQRELALPGLLANALNAFISPERARTGSDTTFNPNEEALNFASNVMGGGVGTSAGMKAPMGQGGKDLAMNSIKDLSDKWNSQGVNLDIYPSKSGEKINLSKIVIDPDKRNQGIGSQVMNDIVNQADNTNATVTLSPSVDFGASSVARLKDFYKQFGFVENKGRNKDLSISESMYRKPIKENNNRKELLKQEFDKLNK
jgi:predicted GNAT family N-acyltransferase